MTCATQKVASGINNVLQDLEDLGRVLDGLLTGNYEPLAGPLRVYARCTTATATPA